MPDLFPTTEEVTQEKLKDDAATGGPSIVNHVGPDSFKKDGLRPFFEYRPLGLKELTGGKVGAHVIRAVPEDGAAQRGVPARSGAEPARRGRRRR